MATALGIDIGKHTIRAALLRIRARGVVAERYLELPIPRISGDGPDDKRAYATVADVLRELPTQPDEIVIALDGSRASIRQVKIPVAAKKRAHEVLPFEIESLVPFSLDDVLIDYQEVAVSDGELSLLCAIVPEALVAKTLSDFDEAGVRIQELAVGAPALDGLLAAHTFAPGEAVVLVHLGEEATDVCIVQDGVAQLGRTLDKGLSALSGEPQALANALHQTVVKYRTEGGGKPARALVSGSGADDPNVVEWVGRALDVVAAPVALPAVAESATTVSPVFGKAFALAARTRGREKRIDLRIGKYSVPRGVNQLRHYAVLAAACAGALIVSYAFRVWAEYEVLVEERDQLAEELEKATELHFRAGTKDPRKAKELLEGSGGADDPLPKFDAFKALATISAAVPTGVVHDARKIEIQIDEVGQGGKLEIQGMLPDLTARDRIMEALDQNECIGELEPGKIQSVPGQDRKSYTLVGAIACPGTVRDTKGKGKEKAKRSTRSE